MRHDKAILTIASVASFALFAAIYTTGPLHVGPLPKGSSCLKILSVDYFSAFFVVLLTCLAAQIFMAGLGLAGAYRGSVSLLPAALLFAIVLADLYLGCVAVLPWWPD